MAPVSVVPSHALRPFDLPPPEGAQMPSGTALLGAPDPSIGPVVCAASTLDVRGFSTDPEHRGQGPIARLLIPVIPALLVGGLGGLGAGFLASAALPYRTFDQWVTPIFLIGALLLAAPVYWFFFAVVTAPGRGGRVLYVGRDGYDVFRQDRKQTQRETLRYTEPATMLTRQIRQSHKGYITFGEHSVFLDERGQLLGSVSGHYVVPERLDGMVRARRALEQLAVAARMQAARRRLASGQSVAFDVFEQGLEGDFSSGQRTVYARTHRVELTETTLDVFDAAGARLSSRPRDGLEIRVQAGRWLAVSADGQAPLGFDCGGISDEPILTQLLEAA